MLPYWLISLPFLLVFFVESLNGFELPLVPRKIDNDTNLNLLTEMLHNIPFLLPTVNLCIGTPSQCLDLALSTANAFSVMESQYSREYNFNKQFNQRESSTFKSNSQEPEMGVFLFGLHYYFIDGKISEDLLTLPIESKQSPIPFRFVLVSPQRRSVPINLDGVIGLQKFYSDSLFFCQKGFSFIEYLKKAQYISKKTFAIEYNSKGGGRALFGEDYTHRTCNSSGSYYYQSQWDCSLTEISLGKETISISGEVQFDSVKSFIYAPEKLGGSFVLEYFLKHYYRLCGRRIDRNNTVIVCDDNTPIEDIPDLILRLNETKIVIQWRNVFREKELNGRKQYIASFIVENVVDELANVNNWVIGVPGFIDNSIVFDYDERRVGIKHLNKEEQTIAANDSITNGGVLIVAGLVGLFGIGLLVVVNIKKVGYRDS